MTIARRGIDRRRVLSLAGVGLVAGCGRQAVTPEGPSSAAGASSSVALSSSSALSPSSAPNSPPPTTAASSTPAAPSTASIPAPSWAVATMPSRETVGAEFADRSPQEWGLTVSGVSQRLLKPAGIALTFDACGGPGGGTGYDADLISLLRTRSVPATLFLNQRWISANPELAAELAADPLFEIENHGTRHLPLSVTGQAAYGIAGTASLAEAYDEVAGADPWFRSTLSRPAWFFRSGTAHYDEVASALCRRVGQAVAGFSVNADAGATYSPGQVAGQVATCVAGDIVIAHMNRPGKGTAVGFAQALPPLLDGGARFVRLADGF